jgi:BirA family transcriptional regulator, biotin operon repressor / biotin---[acetyl-CoA-carboxylase] ligase
LKLPPGHRLLHFHSIDSTNAEARRQALAGEKGPLWICADEQIGGKGRHGRTWVSEPGNLYVTYLFCMDSAPNAAAQISFVAAVAVHELATQLRPDASFSLKWPNDVLMDHAKFCGILAEVLNISPTLIALGCGINLGNAPTDTSYPVAALGNSFLPLSVLEKLAVSLWKWMEIWDEGRGFQIIRNEWIKHAVGIGQNLFLDDKPGYCNGIAADGALLVTMNDGIARSVYAGDVRFAELENHRSGKQ